MIAIPAIDLRDGACVQLVGGDYAAERVRLPDPVAVADRWRQAGFRRLHVVDLDAATGRGDNGAVVDRLLGWGGMEVQVGGGMSSEERIGALLERGAATVVVGTRAIEDPAWLERVVAGNPGRLVVAADVRLRDVTVRGWTRGTGNDVCDWVATLESLRLAGLLVTAVHREGRLAGPDLALVADVVQRTRHPVLASGGIARLDDLDNLARAGASGAIIGMAFYTGALDPGVVAREFAA